MANWSSKKPTATPTFVPPVGGVATGTPLANKQIQTHEGAFGYEREPKVELFLLGVSCMVNEPTFYEKGDDRLKRLRDLTRKVTAEDPEWVQGFVPWLRNTGQVRTASIVVAAEYCAAMGPFGRRVINSAISRADEPAEVLAYWTHVYGRRIPKPVKRGVADAVRRLYRQRAAMKWDGTERAWRMADVIDLVHPKPVDDEQSRLFKWLIDTRHKRDDSRLVEHVTDDLRLATIAEVYAWQQMPTEERRAWLEGGGRLPRAVTWERLSEWLPGGMDAQAWESVIPNMGYMALIRNLRNFDKAGISETAVSKIKAKLTNPGEVRESRQFPLRYFSAYKAVNSVRWHDTLEKGLALSLQNVPSFPGRTLVLVDVSGSMFSRFSARSEAQNHEIASLFGVAVALRAENADLVAYSNDSHVIDLKHREGADVLKFMEKCWSWSGAGGGTNTYQTVATHYNGHDRVILLTDEQAHYGFGAERVMDTIPTLYTFNLLGYRPAHAKARPGHYTFGGLTDTCFRLIDALEQLREGPAALEEIKQHALPA